LKKDHNLFAAMGILSSSGNGHIETERKFLIRMPSHDILDMCEGSYIVQTYITPEDSEGTTDRIRSRTPIRGGETVFLRTKKKRISELSSYEEDVIISKDEYDELLKRRIPDMVDIIKKRYLLPFGGLIFEIDIYPFWHDRAIMEVELPKEDTPFEIPPGIEIIREVTGDSRYKNKSLARSVPYDDI
jgi:CYTH domain-containing protein